MTDSQGSQAACHPNCAFSNPSVAYGLTVLPLNPRENVTAKITNDKTPGYVKDNLDGRYGDRLAPVWQLQQDEVLVLAGCTPPGEASRWAGLIRGVGPWLSKQISLPRGERTCISCVLQTFADLRDLP